MDLRNYDVTNLEPPEEYGPLPVGEYRVIIVDSGEKPTKAGDGSYLELVLEVVDGEYQGRKLWDRLNLNNRNEKAAQIAKRTLAAITRAVGVPRPSDSAELHGVPMLVAVYQEEFNGRVSNRVKSYKPVGSATQPKTTNAAPWARG